ncbi:MAG TPA: HlyD family efflux transporter periplasmic adaptor subunit [Thermoanaerobaculia bacterium]|nr:HlyD family efflux transporter periplasmic adaptor subunit [Thermoanaerobaculia bacterium]
MMDREIAPEVRQRKRIRRILAIFIAVAALAFSFAATLQWMRPSIRRADLELARVERGPVEATIQAGGTIIPAAETVISSPVDSRILRIDRRAGDAVRAGDVVLTLDTAGTRLEVERLESRLSSKVGEQTQLQLAQEETIANLIAQIEQKKLDRDILRFKAAQNERLFKEGLIAEQEHLAAAAAATKSEIELVQLDAAVQRAKRSREAQLSAGASEVDTLKKETIESQRQLALAMMRAERDGVVTWILQDPGATVRRGETVARVADLSSYRVAGSISEMYAPRLRTGMPVKVNVDDATTVTGSISSIDPRAEGGTVKFWVTLDEPSHPRLRNNVRVDLHVVTGRRAGVLRVRRGNLGRSVAEDVFMRRGDQLTRVPVQWGLMSHEVLEVGRGLKEGDEVVVSDMNDYDGVGKLRLK